MKIILSSRGLFVIAFVILVATNIVVLSGVGSNRSGNQEALITLTENELQLPYRVHEENSGLALRLAWRALGKNEEYIGYPDWRSPFWLDAKKLKELGFNIDKDISSEENATFHKQPVPKEVFVVLEYNGEPYREALRRAEIAFKKEEGLLKLNSEDKRLRDNFERAETRLKREREAETRLFAIDAGLDPLKLREKYNDRSRFIITKGLVEPSYNYENKKKEAIGYITKLSIENIHVPLKHRQVFDAILVKDDSSQSAFGRPRYKIELAYGSRLEPWLVSVRHIGDTSG
jgi:Domain of unknown function (DUF4824)